MPANTMISEVRAGHPVLEAVAEFREVLNHLIDEQKALLLNRTVEMDVEECRASPLLSTFTPGHKSTASGDSAASHEPEPKAARPSPAPNKTQTIYHPTIRPPESSSPVPFSDNDDANASVDQRDPRQRLDALARLLDKRLKQSGTNLVAHGTKT